MKIKNHCWKDSRGKADFVVVGDMDECLYSPVLEEELDYMRENNMTLCGPVQYALCGDSFPEYTEGKLIHELVTRAYVQKLNHSFNVTGKIMLFDPNRIAEMNYSPGCHSCRPTGEVKLYDKEHIFCIHTQKGFGVEYKIKRFKELAARLSDNNKRHGYGLFYMNPESKIRNDYQKAINRSVSIPDDMEKRLNRSTSHEESRGSQRV